MTTQVSEMSIEAHEVGSVSVKYLGDGFPLVFLHGGEGPAPIDFLRQLAPSRVIAPEFPGLGSIKLPPTWNDIADLADYVADVLDGFGVDRADVVGHSLGGYVAATLATRSPCRIRRLVLSAPIGVQVDGIVLPSVFAMRPEAVASMLGYPPSSEPRPLRLVEREALGRFLFATPFNRRLLAKLGRVKCPSLVVRGERDQFVPAEYAMAYAKALGATYQELAGQAHAMPLLAPDALAAAVRSFVNGEEGA